MNPGESSVMGPPASLRVDGENPNLPATVTDVNVPGKPKYVITPSRHDPDGWGAIRGVLLKRFAFVVRVDMFGFQNAAECGGPED